ncbi:hypothetical protein L218DRAFT_957392, partial [Marasmius fiardii PR-910]
MGGSSSEIWEINDWPAHHGSESTGCGKLGDLSRTSQTAPRGPGHPTPGRSGPSFRLAIGKTGTWDMIGDLRQRHQ